MSKARLILTCGLLGAGKTTLAKEGPPSAARCAARRMNGSGLWDPARGTATLVRGSRASSGAWPRSSTLELSVVFDFGLWARVERDELRTVARDLGVGVELLYLDVPTEELWRRIEARNAVAPWNDEPIERADLDEWMRVFQPPDADELALYDPPPAQGTDRRR